MQGLFSYLNVPSARILLRNLQLRETSYTSVAATILVVCYFCVEIIACSSRRHCRAHTVPVATQMDETAGVYYGNGGGQSEGGGIWRCTALQWTFAFITTLVSGISWKLEFLARVGKWSTLRHEPYNRRETP